MNGWNGEVYMTYGDWNNISTQNNAAYLQRMQYERKKRADYYYRQRILGFEILSIGMIVAVLCYFFSLAFLGAVGTVVALIGLYVILSKHMILVDEYYFECMDRIGYHQ